MRVWTFPAGLIAGKGYEWGSRNKPKERRHLQQKKYAPARRPYTDTSASHTGPLTPGMVELTVTEATLLDEALGAAIAQVMEAAIHHRVGVMVTRIGPDRYIVRAHPAVPYGLTRQNMASQHATDEQNNSAVSHAGC